MPANGPFPDTRAAGQSEAMAAVLEARHGAFAAEVAVFFASFHEQLGDARRCALWSNVARAIHERERDRLEAWQGRDEQG